MSADTPPPPAAAASTSDDWRLTMPQSDRNQQVREIAQVLASLEPGARATSKLRLAMQFEDTVFRSSDSLADYRKRLAKRLKKVQKSYVPAPVQVVTSQREKALLALKAKYGATIQYILQHASKAVQETKLKYGEDKANKLKLHTDGVKLWASDLGLLENTQLHVKMSDEHLEKLTMHLERNADIIRSHVVKSADPDQFLLETLEKTQTDITPKASRILAVDAQRRYQQIQKQPQTVDALTLLQESIQRAHAPVPVPTRTERNDVAAALVHLDKLRAAATAVLAYMMVNDKATSVPPHTLSKLQQVAHEGVPFVETVMKDYRKNTVTADLTLQDAWLKRMELAVASANNSDPLDTTIVTPVSMNKPVVIRSQVLLTAGRKTPFHLVPELKRKRVILVRPPPNGQGTHLLLHFGTAFTMTIYLVPLVVTLRAYDATLTSTGTAWTPLHAGLLMDGKDWSVWGVTGSYDTVGCLVEERLRDASAHATHFLRQVFSKAHPTTTTNNNSSNDFEMEIREASALLEFIHLARRTYQPEWQDDDIDTTTTTKSNSSAMDTS
jgi:hypothetical protein